MSFTEEEIRAAWRKTGLSSFSDVWLETLFTELNRKKNRVHDFADTDIITVKELREAWNRAYPTAFPLRGADFTVLLKNISEHREPEYPYASTWMDDNGVVWHRTMDDGGGKVHMWLRMGYPGKFSDSQPKRPLKRMDVVS